MIIKIKDFHKILYTRASGEFFRDKLLIPTLNNSDVIIINLDDCSLGSSFLNEAFSGIGKKYPNKKIHFISEQDPSLIIEIKEYMNDNCK